MPRTVRSHPEVSSSLSSLSSPEFDAWVAYMRVQLRMNYEINRQLQRDSGLSLADYHVLNALSNAPDHKLQITDLAALIGWERSRLSHHSRRLESRGLVELRQAASDRRATEITLTESGWDEITSASYGHVELVRHLFFDGVPYGLLEPLTVALASVYERLVEHGTLPAPSDKS